MSKRIQVLVLDDMLEWIEGKIRSGRYESVSQVVRSCIRECMDKEKREHENE